MSTPLFADDVGARVAIDDVLKGIESIQKQVRWLATISLSGVTRRSLEQFESLLTDQYFVLSDAVFYMNTGVDAELLRKNEESRIRLLKKERLPKGYTLVRRGKLLATDLIWDEQLETYVAIPNTMVCQNATLEPSMIYRHRPKKKVKSGKTVKPNPKGGFGVLADFYHEVK